MGKNIYGSIEVRGTYQPQMGHIWIRVVDLGFVFSRVPKLYSDLFDVYDDNPQALFANRGLPGDTTPETMLLFNKIARQQVIGRVSHTTWFTYYELMASDWLSVWDTYIESEEYVGLEMKNWTAAFEVAGTLTDHYGTENVRFVVWFDNG